MIDERSAAWRAQYADYLDSQEWSEKRQLVMERAGDLCEGCRQSEAAEVHHLTYENVTREFLFELVAMCADCHDRWHQMKGQAPRPIERTWQRRKTPTEIWKEKINKARW